MNLVKTGREKLRPILQPTTFTQAIPRRFALLIAMNQSPWPKRRTKTTNQ